MDKTLILSSISIGIIGTIVYAMVSNPEQKPIEDRKEDLCILSVVIMISSCVVLLCFGSKSSTALAKVSMTGGLGSHNTLPPF